VIVYSRGGAMKIGNRLNWMSDNMRTPAFKPDFNLFIWHLPLRTADMAATGQTSDMYQDAINHPAFDAFWKSISTRERLGKIKVPVFAAGGWYDNFVESDLEAYMALRKNRT
jgi:predicted acyl esterase